MTEYQQADKARELRRATARDPADWQEDHSPTVPVEIRLTGSRSAEVCRRRTIDARLWDAMRPDQQAAAERIYRGFSAITVDVTAKIATMERVDGGGAKGTPERLAGRMEAYLAWARHAQRQGVRVAEVLDILVFGKSCRQVDRERRQRRHMARRNLFEGLEVYCRLKGWAGHRSA